jgi:hypothetical protein
VRGEWITSHVGTLSDHRAKEALSELRAQGIADIGIHLREARRHAMAHATNEPIIDPDDPAEFRRIRAELPIMTELATVAIEEVFGVETSHTIYRKHLYELAGFKAILGPEIVARLVNAEQIVDGTVIDIPRINVRLRGHAPFKPLEKLSPVEIGQDGSVLFLFFRSDEGNVEIRFGLNFSSERLEFDVFRDIAIQDTGTADGALALVDFKQFRNTYFGNGQLEIYDAESNELLSRKDAYLPTNMWLDHEAAEADLEQWRKIAEERRKTETGGS